MVQVNVQGTYLAGFHGDSSPFVSLWAFGQAVDFHSTSSMVSETELLENKKNGF